MDIRTQQIARIVQLWQNRNYERNMLYSLSKRQKVSFEYSPGKQIRIKVNGCFITKE